MPFWKNRSRICVFENRDTKKQLSELALEHGHASGSNAAPPPRTEVVLAGTFSAAAAVRRMRFGK
ncbi:hypothetical protein PanWU01x14_013440 [Parasponia andersonii]|uniref:Uncharacterized protein n=1 Tax=Parasponia andersonii TaxID=3476 RepID=A0A2P5E132_PARAD|nr:hypothetical protein PanWU01x14_013440 [Parasponia andersonii]